MDEFEAAGWASLMGEAYEVMALIPPAPAWQRLALCIDADPETFFPAKGESAEPAKRVCASCPVQAECLEFILEEEDGVDVTREGVWGGTTPKERKALGRLPRRDAA